MVSQELIKRFFEGPLDPEESEAVVRYLREHPEVISSLFSEEEWLQYLAANTATQEKELPALPYLKTVKSQSTLQKIARWLPAAAAVMGLVAGLYFFNKKKPDLQPHQFFSNTGTDSMMLVLSDSSVVHLAPASDLAFEMTSSGERRAHLKGGAFFSVVHSQVHRFIVVAGEIQSEVLGTRFSIQANQSDSFVMVQLHSGRLKTHCIARQLLPESYILQPGDIYYFSRNSYAQKLIRPAESGKAAMKSKNVEPEKAASNPQTSVHWYMFNNQPLGDVFEQLERIYNVRIKYDTADLQNLTFIGRIDQRDTLERILKDLTRLNGLKLTRDRDGFTIKK